MNNTEKDESDVISQAIEHIILHNDGTSKPPKEHATVLYITSIITTMGTVKKPQDIFKVLSSDTPKAFDEIGAHEYAEVFDSTYKSAMEETSQCKTPFSKHKHNQILKDHATAIFVAVETLEENGSLVGDYLVPYIKKNFKFN